VTNDDSMGKGVSGIVELLIGVNNKESKKESRQLTTSHNLIDWLLKPVTDELIQVCQG